MTDVSQTTQQSLINFTKLFITPNVLSYPLPLWNEWLKESGIDDATISIHSGGVCIRIVVLFCSMCYLF